MRDMKQTAQKVDSMDLDTYCMTLTESKELADLIKSGKVYDAIQTAFNYGFVLGNRATIAGKITKKL